MMDCEQARSCFDDYVDDRLSEERRAAVANHRCECVSCRRELGELESLLTRAREMEADIAPARDLWPQIATRMEAAGRWGMRRYLPLGSAWPRFAMAAASIVVASLVAVGWWLGGTSGGDPAGTAPPPHRSAEATFASSRSSAFASADVLQVRSDLREVVKRQRHLLAPETVAVVEENMAVIDEAINEILGALENAPGNRTLNLLLAAQYQREVDLMNRLSRL